MVDAKKERKAARVRRTRDFVTAQIGDELGLGLGLARLGDGDSAHDASHRDRARIEQRKTRRVDFRRETHVCVQVEVVAQRRRGERLDDDLDGRSRVLCEETGAFEDAFERDRGVFFGCVWDGGERADVDVDGCADGVFGCESGGDGTADGGEGGGGTEGEAG